MDSQSTGGLTWIYDQGHDKVVNIANPPDRVTSNPTTIGTAITDHYARFRSPSYALGWVYRWDDTARAWVYVVGDPAHDFIEQTAFTGKYLSSAGWIGPSRLWAIGNSGSLYYLADVTPPK